MSKNEIVQQMSLGLYFKEVYKMLTIDLNKQKTLDADATIKRLINFTGNLQSVSNTNTF